MQVFTKYIDVFGINIFATQAVSDNDIKHCAAVMAEYLDNDENGTIDNQLVVDEMVAQNASMVMFGSDGSADQSTFFNSYNGNWALQDLYGDETHPNGSTQQNGFDATLEEVLHLITHVGYANVYPNVWGENVGTSLGNAMDIARGGQFITIPATYPASAWYHYDDFTCDYSCMATEYLYWSLTTLLGAQDYTWRCNQIANEWELCSAADFQTTDTSMYALLTTPEYKFATSIPDGNYCPSQASLLESNQLQNQISLFPNPFKESFYLEFESPEHYVEVQVYDIDGKAILNMNASNVNHLLIQLPEAKSGIYFAECTTDQGTVIFKCVKQ